MSPYWRSTQFEEDRRRNDRELRAARAQRVREQAERAKRDAGRCDTDGKKSDR